MLLRNISHIVFFSKSSLRIHLICLQWQNMVFFFRLKCTNCYLYLRNINSDNKNSTKHYKILSLFSYLLLSTSQRNKSFWKYCFRNQLSLNSHQIEVFFLVTQLLQLAVTILDSKKKIDTIFHFVLMGIVNNAGKLVRKNWRNYVHFVSSKQFDIYHNSQL